GGGQEAALRALRHAQDVDSVQDRKHADHGPPDNWQGVGQDVDSGPDYTHGDHGCSDNWQEVGQDIDSGADHTRGDHRGPDNWHEVGQHIDSGPDPRRPRLLGQLARSWSGHRLRTRPTETTAARTTGKKLVRTSTPDQTITT